MVIPGAWSLIIRVTLKLASRLKLSLIWGQNSKECGASTRKSRATAIGGWSRQYLPLAILLAAAYTAAIRINRSALLIAPNRLYSPRHR
jgi:hypothetical protein